MSKLPFTRGFSSVFGTKTSWVLALLLLLLQQSARAHIWGFVDEQGVAHLASSQIDARYALLAPPVQDGVAPLQE